MTAELVQSLASDIASRKNGTVGHRYGYDELNDYWTGNQALKFLHPEVESQVGDRLTSLAINWPRVVVGAIEERLDVTGFRATTDQSADADLWEIWKENGLEEWAPMAHTDAMVCSRTFGLTWGDDDGAPHITVESASQMTVKYRQGSRRIDAALKIFADPDADPNKPAESQVAWLYLPDSAQKYRGSGMFGSAWKPDGSPKPNPLGVVPVVPLVNRPSLTNLSGESELVDIIPLADAVNKLATDMMVSSEFHAMPRRYATGIEVPKETQRNDRLHAEAAAKWDDMTKGKTWLAGPNVAFGQFPEATLDNFISAIRMLEAAIAALGGLPPHYMGLAGDNPASADAIRSAESSLVKKAFRKQHGFGGSWAQLMRLAIAVRDGVPFASLDKKWRRLETQWADPNTSTPGAKADAALKLVSGERPIITINQAREDLGYTPGQISRMNNETAKQVADTATADVQARIDLAQTLMSSQGLSQGAAYAAVGLLAAASQMSAPSPDSGAVAGGAAPAAAQN